MKKSVNLLLVLSFLVVSCTKTIDPSDNISPPGGTTPPPNPGLPSAAIIKSSFESRTANVINYDLDLVIFNSDGSINASLSAANFETESFTSTGGTSFTFSLNQINLSQQISNGPFSATLLLDQSGSLGQTDPNNIRIDAAEIFCRSLGAGDNIFLSAFASSGAIPYDLTIYGSGFTSDGASYIADLENLKNQVAGGTPLYKSIYSMADYTFQHAPNANKALVVFTDGDDTNGEKTDDDAINLAKSKGIKIFTVGLGSGNTNILAKIANKTGGAFMFAADARQLISMFGSLGKLLGGTAQFYHSSWTVAANGNIGTSGWLTNSVKITLPNGSYIYAPFRVDY